MSATPPNCTRLLTALEDLVGQEGAVLRARDFTSLLALQERMEPLVAWLADHGEELRAAGLQERVATLAASRRRHAETLAGELEATRAEMRAMQAHQRTVARVGPVYSGAAPAARQLSCVG